MALRPHFRLDQECEICRSRPDVERPPVRHGGYIGGGQAFPVMVEAETQQGIIEIVAARDCRKHPLDRLLAGLARPG